jgi:NAD+ kinase
MKFAIVGNADKQGIRETLEHVLTRLASAGMDYAVDEELAPFVDQGQARTGVLRKREECLDGANMVLALGGDGTLLSAARSVGPRGTPILGVNLGRLGFLAAVAPGELDRALGDILANNYVVEERLMLEARLPGRPGSAIVALNDIVIDKSRSSRAIDIETHINGTFAVTYRGDGLIISSPTGSTAYALSNGGPIVTPTSRVLGITPISPHTLSGRPLIVPDESIIRIIAKSSGEEVLVSADGQEELYLPPPVEIVVKKSAFSMKLVKSLNDSYFDTLRAKLHWGRDPRG